MAGGVAEGPRGRGLQRKVTPRLDSFPSVHTLSLTPMALASPLRALVGASPDQARALIRRALKRSGGHRGKAAEWLATGGANWLPREDSYRAMWRCIVALDMGAEIAERWPVGAAATTKKGGL
jgi:hypothetical protein